MEQSQERWRRPGIRLAIGALVVIAFYFLVIFVRQSWNLYQLGQEKRAQDQRVVQLEEEVKELEQRLAEYTDEEGRPMVVKDNLPYKEPGELVAIPVESGTGGGSVPAEGQPAGATVEDLASLPAWQQWWRVIFTPASP